MGSDGAAPGRADGYDPLEAVGAVVMVGGALSEDSGVAVLGVTPEGFEAIGLLVKIGTGIVAIMGKGYLSGMLPYI